MKGFCCSDPHPPPWRPTTYQQHCSRVNRARSAIDDKWPKPRAHLTVNAKGLQLERERQARILRENFILLKKLQSIMDRKRVKVENPRLKWTESRCIREMQSDSGSYVDGDVDVDACEGELQEEGEGSHSERRSVHVQVVCKSLTESEASKCLGTLGKCDSGLGYAYLELNASKRGLTQIGSITKFKHLISVDVSGNRLTIDAVQVLCSMKYLLVLRVDSNQLDSGEMQPMPYLQVLTLNNNYLRDTKGIRHGLLERLELNRNKIEQVDDFDFDQLGKLKRLELRENLLTTTRGLGSRTIVELYLADNSIEKLEGLGILSSLKVLHLRANKISCLQGFSSECVNLTYLNLRANRITNISECEKLACLPALETLVLVENPAFGQQDEEEKQVAYRRYILAILPKLNRIDKEPVTYQEREDAGELRIDYTMQNSGEFSPNSIQA